MISFKFTKMIGFTFILNNIAYYFTFMLDILYDINDLFSVWTFDFPRSHVTINTFD